MLITPMQIIMVLIPQVVMSAKWQASACLVPAQPAESLERVGTGACCCVGTDGSRRELFCGHVCKGLLEGEWAAGGNRFQERKKYLSPVCPSVCPNTICRVQVVLFVSCSWVSANPRASALCSFSEDDRQAEDCVLSWARISHEVVRDRRMGWTDFVFEIFHYKNKSCSLQEV